MSVASQEGGRHIYATTLVGKNIAPTRYFNIADGPRDAGLCVERRQGNNNVCGEPGLFFSISATISGST